MTDGSTGQNAWGMDEPYRPVQSRCVARSPQPPLRCRSGVAFEGALSGGYPPHWGNTPDDLYSDRTGGPVPPRPHNPWPAVTSSSPPEHILKVLRNATVWPAT
jgi:hypothetical protein